MARPSPQTTRVVTIVELLTHRADRGATLTEIAHHVGQTPAACVHVLAALADAGFVVRRPSDRRYHLGPALIAPGRVASDRFPRLAAIRAALEDLAAVTGLVVCAYRRDDRSYARLIEAVTDPSSPAPGMRIGDLLPLDAPLGSVFIAWSGDDVVEQWLGDYRDQPATRDALRARLQRVGEQGFVVEVRLQPPLDREVARLLARGRDLRRAERIGSVVPGVEYFVETELEPRAQYDAVAVSVPVPPTSGDVELSIAVTGFAGPTTGRRLLQISRHARICAGRLGTVGRPAPPRAS